MLTADPPACTDPAATDGLARFEESLRHACAYVRSLGRARLTKTERAAFAWLLAAVEPDGPYGERGWSRPDLAAALARAPAAQGRQIFDLLAELRPFVDPDPVEQVRVKRRPQEDVVARPPSRRKVQGELPDGAEARDVTAGETAAEKAELLGQLLRDAAALAKDLARQGGYPGAERLAIVLGRRAEPRVVTPTGLANGGSRSQIRAGVAYG